MIGREQQLSCMVWTLISWQAKVGGGWRDQAKGQSCACVVSCQLCMTPMTKRHIPFDVVDWPWAAVVMYSMDIDFVAGKSWWWMKRSAGWKVRVVLEGSYSKCISINECSVHQKITMFLLTLHIMWAGSQSRSDSCGRWSGLDLSSMVNLNIKRNGHGKHTFLAVGGTIITVFVISWWCETRNEGWEINKIRWLGVWIEHWTVA